MGENFPVKSYLSVFGFPKQRKEQQRNFPGIFFCIWFRKEESKLRRNKHPQVQFQPKKKNKERKENKVLKTK